MKVWKVINPEDKDGFIWFATAEAAYDAVASMECNGYPGAHVEEAEMMPGEIEETEPIDGWQDYW